MVLILAENGHAGMLLAIASLALVAVFGGLTILALLVADGRIGLSPRALWRVLGFALVSLAVVLLLLLRGSVLS